MGVPFYKEAIGFLTIPIGLISKNLLKLSKIYKKVCVTFLLRALNILYDESMVKSCVGLRMFLFRS